jgi:hypothetical protein
MYLWKRELVGPFKRDQGHRGSGREAFSERRLRLAVAERARECHFAARIR